MKRNVRVLSGLLLGALLCWMPAAAWAQEEFEEARIYIEYNSTDEDLGYHVFLDGEDWESLEIFDPDGNRILMLEAEGGYEDLGLTELFFEGAEPPLDEVPLDELLARFPEGEYTFRGVTADAEVLESTAELTHAVPAGPKVKAEMRHDRLVVKWTPVPGVPEDFPDRDVEIVEYQIIVDSFQVNMPGSARRVAVPRRYFDSLEPGEHEFEVLAIEAGGNQTITSGFFEIEGGNGE
jgi:hypothetical protein